MMMMNLWRGGRQLAGLVCVVCVTLPLCLSSREETSWRHAIVRNLLDGCSSCRLSLTRNCSIIIIEKKGRAFYLPCTPPPTLHTHTHTCMRGIYPHPFWPPLCVPMLALAAWHCPNEQWHGQPSAGAWQPPQPQHE